MITLDHSPVHSDPAILGGTLVFRGTRVPAQTLLDYQNDGYGLQEFLEFFPSVQQDDAQLFLEMVRDSLQNLSGKSSLMKTSPGHLAVSSQTMMSVLFSSKDGPEFKMVNYSQNQMGFSMY